MTIARSRFWFVVHGHIPLHIARGQSMVARGHVCSNLSWSGPTGVAVGSRRPAWILRSIYGWDTRSEEEAFFLSGMSTARLLQLESSATESTVLFISRAISARFTPCVFQSFVSCMMEKAYNNIALSMCVFSCCFFVLFLFSCLI